MVVLVATSVLLLCTPPWFVHYAGLIAAPAAIMVGAATRTLIGAVRSFGARGLIASLLVAGLAVVAVPILSASFGRPFPAAPIARRRRRSAAVSRPTIRQRFAIDYLRSGSAVIVMRFNRGFGFSAHSATVVQGWPVLLQAGHVVLRRSCSC